MGARAAETSDGLCVGSYGHDDALLERARVEGRGQVAVYCLEQTVVVLGRGSKPERELDLAACRQDGVEVVRRRGGGCSVVLDAGNVIVSYAAPLTGLGDNKRLIQGLADWLAGGLARIGIEGVSRRGISDLVQGERKVSGSCVHRSRDLYYFSASLLVAPRLELMTRYLAHPPREPDYRAGRAHEAFVGPLVDPSRREAREIAAALGRTLAVPELRR